MRDCIWIRSKAKSLVWLSSSTSSRKGPRANLLFQLLCLWKRFLSLEIKRKSPENRLRFVAVFSIAVVDGWKEDSLGSRARVHSLISFVYSLFPLSLSLFLSSALFFAYSLLSTWTTKSFVIFIYYNDIGTHMLRGPPTTTKYELLNFAFCLSLLTPFLFRLSSLRDSLSTRILYISLLENTKAEKIVRSSIQWPVRGMIKDLLTLEIRSA